jgi:hypothetical protein
VGLFCKAKDRHEFHGLTRKEKKKIIHAKTRRTQREEKKYLTTEKHGESLKRKSKSEKIEGFKDLRIDQPAQNSYQLKDS